MAIYTRTGDKGETSVIGGRVGKDDVRVEAYGTIDELNCFVGQARSLMEDEKFSDVREQLLEIQHELFDCGSDLAFVKLSENKYKVKSEMAVRLEGWIDQLQAENPVLERFILPGGSQLSSVLHVCRTVCRRAERRAVTLGRSADINPEAVIYLNRLSDYFFALARAANTRLGIADVEYVRSKRCSVNKMSSYYPPITYIVPQSEDGWLLKTILQKRMDVSRKLLSRLKMTEQGIMLNGERVYISVKVAGGDRVEIRMEQETSVDILPQDIPFDILYEDEHLLVVNKAAGIIVHPTHGHYTDTLANGVVHYWAAKGEQYRFRPVHRLDQETSGVLVIAKNPYSHQHISEQMIAGTVDKRYAALCTGACFACRRYRWSHRPGPGRAAPADCDAGRLSLLDPL